MEVIIGYIIPLWTLISATLINIYVVRQAMLRDREYMEVGFVGTL